MDKINNIEKVEKIEEHLKEVFKLLNVTETESNKDTANRVARMWVNEVFRNLNHPECEQDLKASIKTFPADTSESLIIVTTPFHAFCEHHLLPFSGKVQIGYLPNKKLIGLSKIPRIVDYWCHKPQLQESLCTDILNSMIDATNSNYVAVRVMAEHSCVACRGIERDCETDVFFSKSAGKTVEEKERLNAEFLKRGDKLKWVD